MTSTAESRDCLHEYKKTNEVKNGAGVGRAYILVFDLYMGMWAVLHHRRYIFLETGNCHFLWKTVLWPLLNQETLQLHNDDDDVDYDEDDDDDDVDKDSCQILVFICSITYIRVAFSWSSHQRTITVRSALIS